MTEPEKRNPVDRERELGIRNLVRMIGLFAFVSGLGLIVLSAADLIKAVVTDAQVRYDWAFYVGLVVLIVGWWFLLAGYGKEEKARYVDCPACGRLNDLDAATCRVCGETIT